MNYEEYEGKEVEVIEDRGDRHISFKGVVTGCDYDIGITIDPINKKEAEILQGVYLSDIKHLSCLNGPSSPEFKSMWYTEEQYSVIFHKRLQSLRKGVLSYREVDESDAKIGLDEEITTGMANCSFK